MVVTSFAVKEWKLCWRVSAKGYSSFASSLLNWSITKPSWWIWFVFCKLMPLLTFNYFLFFLLWLFLRLLCCILVTKNCVKRKCNISTPQKCLFSRCIVNQDNFKRLSVPEAMKVFWKVTISCDMIIELWKSLLSYQILEQFFQNLLKCPQFYAFLVLEHHQRSPSYFYWCGVHPPVIRI